MNRLRQFLALGLLALFLYITAGLLPAFLNNLRLQRYVEALTQSAAAQTQAAGSIRSQVVQRAGELGLPVGDADVQVENTETSVRVSVRYVMPIRFPGYVVKLHFSPSAGR